VYSPFVGVITHASGSGFDGNGVLYSAGNFFAMIRCACSFDTKTTLFTRVLSVSSACFTAYSCLSVVVCAK